MGMRSKDRYSIRGGPSAEELRRSVVSAARVRGERRLGQAMRFPVVLFDLDGTVVDSGEIILASMRHATRTVLAREIPAEDLLAVIGGPGLERVMHALEPTRAE